LQGDFSCSTSTRHKRYANDEIRNSKFE
jgi:hypothetical protein